MSRSTARRSLPSRQPGVVAGGDRVEAQRQRAGRQRRELDPLVAPHAGVGGLAAGVGRDEVVDHVLGEPVREIPDIERDSEDVGDPARVAGVFLGAAARANRCAACPARPTARGARRPPRDRRRPSGRRRPTSRRRRSSRPEPSLRDRSRSWPARLGGPASTAPGSTSSAASTSASTLLWPNESRSDPRALAGSAPIAISTCDGCATPAVQAEPGRAFDSVGVQQHQQRVALAAAEGEVRVAREAAARRGHR